MQADHTATDHDDTARRHTRDAADENPATTGRTLERNARRLDGKAPCHLAHRCQQRQAAFFVRYGFVGNGRATRLDQRRRLLRIGRKMEIREQDLAFVKLGTFVKLRFFDLYDHVGGLEDRSGSLDDLRTGVTIIVV
jgi:hypothetical protein